MVVPVSLNIKNVKVLELSRALAARTGQPQTSVIEEALRRMLEELDRPVPTQDRRAHVDRLLEDFDVRLSDEDRMAVRHIDLYDERGLPA